MRPAKKVYDKKLQSYTNYNEGFRSKVTSVANITSTHGFSVVITFLIVLVNFKGMISVLKKRLEKYKEMKIIYGKEVKELKVHIS